MPPEDNSLEGNSSSAYSSSLESAAPKVQTVVVQRGPSLLGFNKLAFKVTAGALAVIMIIAGAGLLYNNLQSKKAEEAANKKGNYAASNLSLSDVKTNDQLKVGQADSLSVNGKLSVSNTVVITPGTAPSSATAGQIYYDKTANALYYYNGSAFVPVAAQNALVSSLGGLTGAVNTGAGISAAGGTLQNTGVLSVQGQTGIVNFTAGGGVEISGTTISTAALPNGQLVLGTGTNGFTTVAQASGVGQCLISTGGAPVFGSCTGSTQVTSLNSLINGLNIVGGSGISVTDNGSNTITVAASGGAGVTSLNGLSGALTVANATSLGSTVTINNALPDGSTKGIAAFNATNFKTTSGAINTIQDINTTATPTFGGLNLTSALAIGSGGTGVTTAPANGRLLIGNGSGYTVANLTAGAGINITNGAGSIQISSPGSGTCAGCADQALSNLLGVAINASLLPGTTNTIDVGSPSKVWANGYFTNLFGSGANVTALNAGNISSGTLAIARGGTGVTGTPTNGQLLIGNGSGYTVANLTAGAGINITNGAGSIQISSPGSGTCAGCADQALSNLLGVAINASLLPGTTNTIDVGSPSKVWANGYYTNLFADNTITATGGLLTNNITNSSGILTVNSAGNIEFQVGSDTFTFPTGGGAGQQICTTSVTCAAGGGQAVLLNVGATPQTSSGANPAIFIRKGGAGGDTANLIQLQVGAGANDNAFIVDAAGSASFQQAGGLTLGKISNTTGVLKLANIGSSFLGTLQVASLGQNTTYTLPDPGGNTSICLTSGNCTGAGFGITGSGTDNTIALFTSGGTAVGNSALTQSSGNLIASGDLTVQGGDLTLGTASQTGTLNLKFGGTAFSGSIVQGTLTASRTYTLPDSTGDFCLSSGNCLGGGGGGAPNGAAYLTIGNDGTLSAERAITAGTNLTATDGGADTIYTLAVVSNPTFAGLVTASAGLTVTAGQTFTFNGDGFTDLTGTGLTIGGGALQSTLGTTVDLASEVTGTLPVARGGTGVGTFTANGILYGNTTGVVLATTAAANSILVTDGLNVPSLSQTLPNAVQDNIVRSGALASGSIATGFGTISTSSNITTSATLQGGTGVITGAGGLTIGGGGAAGNLYLGNSVSADLVVLQGLNPTGAGNATVQFPATLAAGTDTFCLQTAANCSGGVSSIGAIDGQPKTANGAVINSAVLYMQSADGTYPGLVTVGTQTLAGAKTLSGAATFSAAGTALTVNNDAVIQGTNGLTLGVTGTTTGSLKLLSSTAASGTITVQAAARTFNTIVSIPTDANGTHTTDTFCLLTLGNCVGAGGGVTTSTGANNYVARFTGATTLGVGQLYDTGSLVSVGGTTPAALFNVGATNQFQVSSVGAVTAVGVNSGSGLLQGIGGLTLTGTAQINASGSGATTIGNDSGGAILIQGASTIGIGNNAIAQTLSIGNITGATAINQRVGTGGFTLDGVTNSAYNIGASTTTGTILIGGTAQTGNITLGSSTGAASVLIGNGTGASTVSIANNVATATGNTVNIAGGATATGLTDTVNIATGNSAGTGSKVVHIADGAPAGAGTNTVIIGSLINGSSTTIQGGTGTGAITLTPAIAGTIVIGRSDGTGNITLGSSSGAQSILIGNGAGAPTVSIGNASVSGATINIAGAANTSANTVNIANGASAANSTVNILSGTGTAGAGAVNIGNNTRVTGIDIGNIAAAAARTINVGTGSNTAAIDTLNIGTGATTVAGGKTINIGNGTPSGSGTNIISVGAIAGGGSSTTIQGGTSGTAVSVQSGGGAINIGSSGVANTIQVGNTSGTNAQTINVGNNATASSTSTLTIGSLIGSSTTAIQGGTGATSITATSNTTTGVGLTVTANALTTGSALSVTGSSALRTSGNLAVITSSMTNATAGAVADTSILLNVARTVTNNLGGTVANLNSTKANYTAGTTVSTTAHSVNGANSNRVMVAYVIVRTTTASAPTTLTADDSGAMTAQGGIISMGNLFGTYYYGRVFYKVAPAGGSHTVTATLTGTCASCEMSLVSEDWYDAAQSSPIGAVAAASAAYGVSPSVTLTGATIGDSVGDHALPEDSCGTFGLTATPGTGQTQSNLTCASGGAYSLAASYKYNIPSTSTTMYWNTLNIGYGPYSGSTIAMSIHPANPPAVYTLSGSAATISSNCSNGTGGTCIDTGNVLTLNQQNTGAQGAVLKILNSGTGVDIQLATGGIDRGTAGAINIGATTATSVNIGNGSGSTAVSVLCGTEVCGFGNNAVAHTTTVGSITGTATSNLQGGTGGVNIGGGGIANTVQIGNTTGAVSQTINIGNNTTASSTNTVVIGSTIGTSPVTIQSGTSGIAATSTTATGTGLAITSNSLTTGNGLSVSSSGTLLTSANIASASETAAHILSFTRSGSTLNVARAVSISSPAVALDNSALTSVTGNVTINYPSGYGRAVYLTIRTFGPAPTAVKFNTASCASGTDMTQRHGRQHASAANGIYIYELLDSALPAAAGTYQICVSGSTGEQPTYMSLINVDQSTPTESPQQNDTNSITITNATGSMSIDAMSKTANQAWSSTGGQSCAVVSCPNGLHMMGYSSTVGSVVHSWSPPTSTDTAHAGFSVRKNQPVLTVTGPAASISSNCTAGSSTTCADSGNVLRILQSNTSATGTALFVQNAGIGMGLVVQNASSGVALAADTVNGAVAVGTSKSNGIFSAGAGIYSTGTITQSGTAITGSGTTFTQNMSGGTIYYPDGTASTVTYVSATSLTSSVSKTVAAGSAYTLAYGGMTVKAGGSTYIQPTSDTATAIRVQNATGTNLLVADTTNMRVSVGNIGTATGQVFVSGSVASAALSSVGGQANAWGVAVQGRYAYIATSGTTNGLQVYDVSNPASVTQFGAANTISSAKKRIKIQGKYAYISSAGVANVGTLEIFDISNPKTPVSVGSKTYATTGNGNQPALYVQGRYAYVGDGSTLTLYVFDVSNPVTIPTATSLSIGASGGGIADIVAQGRYVYLAESGATASSQFQIIDMANPSSPSIVSTVTNSNIAGAVTSLAVQGRYAYVGNSTGTIYAVDVKDPSTPAGFSSVAMTGAAQGLYAQGRTLYIADNSSNVIRYVNIAVPGTPVGITGTSAMTGSVGAQALVASGRYLYVPTSNATTNTLQVFDLGGTYDQQLEAGGIETDTLNTRGNSNIGGDESIAGSLTVGGATKLDGNVAMSGQVLLQNATNSTTAFQIQNAAGTQLFNTDTTNSTNTLSGTRTTIQQNVTGVSATLLSDNFDRASLGINWTNRAGTFDINSNKARMTASNGGGIADVSYYNALTPTDADYGVQADVNFNSMSQAVANYACVMGRRTNQATNDSFGYFVCIDNNSGQLRMYKRVTGPGYTELGTPYTIPGYSNNTTYTIKLGMVGTSLTGYLNGTSRVTATDSTYTAAGDFAISAATGDGGTGQTWDNFTVTSSTVTNVLQVLNNGGTSLQSTDSSGRTAFRSGTNSTSAFQVQNATGEAVFNLDTSNGGSALFRNAANSTTAFRIQNAAGTSLITADTTNMNVTITGTLTVSGAVTLSSTLVVTGVSTFNANITVNGHIITGNSSGSSSVAVHSNAGTGATCTLVRGNDSSGQIKIVTGSVLRVAGTQCTLTFANSFGATPNPVISLTTGTSATTDASAVKPYVDASTTTMTINFNTADTGANTYYFNYHITQ